MKINVQGISKTSNLGMPKKTGRKAYEDKPYPMPKMTLSDVSGVNRFNSYIKNTQNIINEACVNDNQYMLETNKRINASIIKYKNGVISVCGYFFKTGESIGTTDKNVVKVCPTKFIEEKCKTHVNTFGNDLDENIRIDSLTSKNIKQDQTAKKILQVTSDIKLKNKNLPPSKKECVVLQKRRVKRRLKSCLRVPMTCFKQPFGGGTILRVSRVGQSFLKGNGQGYMPAIISGEGAYLQGGMKRMSTLNVPSVI